MSKLVDFNGNEIKRSPSVILFTVLLNLESGNAEILASKQNIMRLPLTVRQTLLDNMAKVAQAEFGLKISEHV